MQEEDALRHDRRAAGEDNATPEPPLMFRNCAPGGGCGDFSCGYLFRQSHDCTFTNADKRHDGWMAQLEEE